MNTSSLAPIVLFTYNRPWHTRQTVTALQNNELARNSELFVFSDGPKDENDAQAVDDVRRFIRTISGFKKTLIVERQENRGLADSIISGVSRVVNDHGRVIVLEDDLLTGPHFLRFMNAALDYYGDKKDVWHISGWNYPIDSTGLPDAFLWRVMNCWGWATWADRWQYYRRDPGGVIKAFTREEIFRFNLDGNFDFWRQVKRNAAGKIKSWAIFWYAAIFRHKGLCLNPTRSLVQNIGRDGSGRHCGSGDRKRLTDPPAETVPREFPLQIAENQAVVAHIKRLLADEKERSSLKGMICRLIMQS